MKKILYPGGKYRPMVLSLAVGAFVLDQLSKRLVLEFFFNRSQPVVEVFPFFNLVIVWNHGVSFGMLAALRQPIVLAIVSTVIVGILLVWAHNNASKLVAVALGLVIGGAAGNMFDRLRFGAVTDFLDFFVGPYHWPAFNIADSTIFIGVVLLCISSMLHPDRTKI